jgi:hypothetical protein
VGHGALEGRQAQAEAEGERLERQHDNLSGQGHTAALVAVVVMVMHRA